MTTNTVPGISALQCVISSLRDTAHLSDEGGELTDQLRELRDWALSTAAQPAVQQGEPLAWMDDGTLRVGSEATAYRVVTDATKRGMTASLAASFITPLYAHPAAPTEQPPAAPQEELHEYEWALYEMRGHRPSDKDNWHAGGTATTQAEAEREAAHYLGQYANDDTGFRFEVFEVTRKSLGGLARLPDA